jgi:Na+/melibiose symporter-like transporter
VLGLYLLVVCSPILSSLLYPTSLLKGAFMLDMQRKMTNMFYATLSLPATAMGFALCVQISALSWIMSTKYHLNIEEVGFVWASGPIAGILGQVIIGLVSDNAWFWGGRRRPFILIGGILASLMLFALPNVDAIGSALGTTNLLFIGIAVALLLYLSINVSFNPTRSIIADVTPEGDTRTKGYTWMQTISGMFGVIAYLIGAWLGNYTLIYMGAFLVLAFSIVPTFFITESRELNQAVATSDNAGAIPTGTTDKSRMGLFMGIFNLSVVLPQLAASLFIGKFIQAAPDKSLIFIVAGVSLAISSGLWLMVKEVQSGNKAEVKQGGSGH